MSIPSTKPSIVITGASAGIGRALATEYASRGYRLGLTARRLDVLKALRSELLQRFAQCSQIEIVALDVDKLDQVQPVLNGLFTSLGGADIVVANAGINRLTRVGRGALADELAILQTNVLGAIATCSSAAEHMLARGQGQIVGISSLASLLPLPMQGAYCASKTAFSRYLDNARTELKRKGIAVSTIMPGFITTDIVEGVDNRRMPFAISPEKAAKQMAEQISRRVAHGVVPGWPWRALRHVLPLIPVRFLM